MGDERRVGYHRDATAGTNRSGAFLSPVWRDSGNSRSPLTWQRGLGKPRSHSRLRYSLVILGRWYQQCPSSRTRTSIPLTRPKRSRYDRARPHCVPSHGGRGRGCEDRRSEAWMRKGAANSFADLFRAQRHLNTRRTRLRGAMPSEQTLRVWKSANEFAAP